MSHLFQNQCTCPRNAKLQKSSSSSLLLLVLSFYNLLLCTDYFPSCFAGIFVFMVCITLSTRFFIWYTLNACIPTLLVSQGQMESQVSLENFHLLLVNHSKMFSLPPYLGLPKSNVSISNLRAAVSFDMHCVAIRRQT